MGEILIIPKDSDLLADDLTVPLHTYPDGDVLVEIDGPRPEGGGSAGTPAASGLRLTGVTDEELAEARARMHAPQPEPEADRDRELLAYVALAGPVAPDWLDLLERAGLHLVRYQPENTYLCRGTRAALAAAAEHRFVLQVTPLTDRLKPASRTEEQGTTEIWVVAQGGADESGELVAELSHLPGVELRAGEVDAVAGQLRVRATVTAEGQANLLAHPRVLATEPWAPVVPEDEVAGLVLAGAYNAQGVPVGSYLTWLEDNALNGKGVTIGIVDNGVDETHTAFSGRIRSLDGDKRKWHGTFVAGHAAGRSLGERDDQGFVYGLGTAPGADLLTQDNSRTPAALCRETVHEPGQSGAPATVQNNSWGMGLQDPMDYGSLEATYDALVRNADPDGPTPRPLTICFSAGNSGALGLTRPKAAKNIIVTGNSEVYRPRAGAAESDNINEVYSGSHGSSYGNCGDRRVRPDLVAPGEWTASANYDSREGQREYISPLHTWGGGTSAASPKTAGACALLTQWWRRNNAGATPSPAMLRALLVNGAVDTRAGGPIPNNRQGWGRLNLAGVLAEDVERMYVDQSVALTTKGEQRTWTVEPSDPAEPIKVTLAWTDPPGPVGSGTDTVPAVVNRLALRVETGGATYHANRFAGGWSLAGQLPDPAGEGLDNLQNVYLPAGVAKSTVTVSVVALNVTSDCLSGRPTPPRQDFALVIQNGRRVGAGSPAEVVVAVDEPTGGSEPSDPGGFWDEQADSNDADEQDADWWWETEAASPAGPEADNGNPGLADAAGWWADEHDPASSPGSRPAGAEGGRDERLAEGLRAGLETLAAHADGRVVLAGPGTEDGGGPEVVGVDLETVRADGAAAAAPAPLRLTLERLRADWDTAAAPGDRVPVRRVAVVVVKGGSRFSRADLATLRLLAFGGQLLVVSDSAAVLTFLAQRIGRRLGVQYRLAPGHNRLPAVLAETLAEAGGAHGVELSTRSRGDDNEPVRYTAHVFHLVDADRRVTVEVSWSAGEEPPQAKLRRPGQPPRDVPAEGEADGLRVSRGDGRLRITADHDAAPDAAWSGRWELQLRQADQAEDAGVVVWASGGLDLRLDRREVPTSESGTVPEEAELVSVSGGDGTRFNRLALDGQIIGGGPGAATEASTDLTVTPSRLELEARAATGTLPDTEAGTGEPAYAPAISALAPAPRPPEGARVVDLLLRAEGIDAAGSRFERRLRTSLVHLEPRSSWRRRLASRLVLTPARVIQAHYHDGVLIGLRLAWGGRQRSVSVTSPALREQLTGLDLGAANLHFGVLDDELAEVLVIPDRIEGPITPAAESGHPRAGTAPIVDLNC
jgi:hypothetical protein